MEDLLLFALFFPLISFIISLGLPRFNEKLLSGWSISSFTINLICSILYLVMHLWYGTNYQYFEGFDVVRTLHFEFNISFFYDNYTAVFSIVGALLFLLVAIFSKTYLHREPGFKRFFSTILLFATGFNCIIIAGNLETLLVGWEILGISSFILIAFYRDRYLPVKNAFKVISVYRLSDICIIIAMWLLHHHFSIHLNFNDLQNEAFIQQHFDINVVNTFILALLLSCAAAIKSAQFPFSFWLPRAMEGPTTSSAIFYGSLSVHIGCYMLLRTYPIWHDILIIKLLIIGLGLISVVIASSISSVQATVKTQIAYASIAQIGIIFIEIALGWHTLALLHFTGNALLRTYQLLVSPSVLSYLIHDMFFHFQPKRNEVLTTFRKRIHYSFYQLNIKEWNMDNYSFHYIWQPFKQLGNWVNKLNHKLFTLILILLIIVGVGLIVCQQLAIAQQLYLNNIYIVIAVLCIFSAFTEKEDAIKAWWYIIITQFLIALSVSFNERVSLNQLLIYFSGLIVFGTIGTLILFRIKKIEANHLDLHGFYGHAYEHRKLATVFFISCLGVMGFPLTPTFIGIDLLFAHVHHNQIVYVLFLALTFTFIELAALRVYIRLFLGQHAKQYHEIAYKSS